MENKLIEWSEEFEICEIIDNQHKKMVDIINRLYEAFLKAEVRSIIAPILKELEDYTVYHFSTEEKMFQEKGYKGLKEHRAEHNFFVKQIQDFRKRYEGEDQFVAYDMMNFLKDWLINHILISDMKYKKDVC